MAEMKSRTCDNCKNTRICDVEKMLCNYYVNIGLYKIPSCSIWEAKQ